MRQTVYIDILLSVNLLTDYVLLRAASRLAGRVCSRARMCAASAVGAACSLVILLPPQPLPVRFALTALTAALMTLAGPGYRSAGAYAKMTGCLMLVTLCYGGAMSCLWMFLSPRGIIVNNGAVYLDLSPTVLILSAAVFYAVFSLAAGRLRRRTLERSACRLEIERGGRSAAVDAIFDTGNMLREPFSGLPVIIAERGYIENVLPPGIDGFTDGAAQSASPGGIRVVPYSSVGGGGLLAAFRPDSLKVLSPEGTREAEAYVGVSAQPPGDGCHAIINPDALL